MKLFELMVSLMEDLEGQKQKRLEFLMTTYGPKWQGVPEYKDLKKFIEKLGELDPTRNGAYMQWMAKLIIKNPQENKPEDLHRMADDLKVFEENKSKIENKDINSYKSFQQLYTAIEPFTRPRELSPEEKKAQKEQEKQEAIRKDITDVYTGPEGWIKIPTTRAAAQFIGQNTRWCTSAAGHNYFDHYNKTDNLFVIYDKATKKRFQLHIDSGQFANEEDANEGIKKVPEWSRKPIIAYYKKTAKHLGMKHIMTFGEFGDTDAAKGTDHEDVMELFKKYKII